MLTITSRVEMNLVVHSFRLTHVHMITHMLIHFWGRTLFVQGFHMCKGEKSLECMLKKS